jgi:hypothetical protein
LLGLFDRGIALGEHANQLAAGNCFVDQADRAFARDRQRHERVGKEHRVPKRENRKLVWKVERTLSGEFFDLERFVAVCHGDGYDGARR